jgi:hypothetical protein
MSPEFTSEIHNSSTRMSVKNVSEIGISSTRVRANHPQQKLELRRNKDAFRLRHFCYRLNYTLYLIRILNILLKNR